MITDDIPGDVKARVLREAADELEKAADEHGDTYVPQGLYAGADMLRAKAEAAEAS
jgi:hypothetical protein